MTNPAESTKSKTWMLFESGNGVVVNLSLYPLPKDSNRPIDAYIVTETAGDFTKSARRAAAAVYDILQNRFPDIPQKVVGFDLQGYSRATTGESGGLAFAIALAKKLLNQDPGPVAATGEIVSGHSGGQIGPIKGIVQKLKAAEQLLPENGWLFYPQQNDAEIIDEIRGKLTEKGIKLHPISSVKEALALLFGWEVNLVKTQIVEKDDNIIAAALVQNPVSQKSQSALWPTLIFFLIIIGAAAWFYFPKSDVSENNGTTQITPNPSPRIESSQEVRPRESDVSTSSVPVNKPTTPLSNNQVTINFKGDSSLANELAGLLNEQLPQILADENISLSEMTVSGIVKIIEIKEEVVNNQGNFSSSMTVVLNKLNTKIKDASKSFRDIRITVQDNGQIESLLPLAAIELSTVTANVLMPNTIINNKGFE